MGPLSITLGIRERMGIFMTKFCAMIIMIYSIGLLTFVAYGSVDEPRFLFIAIIPALMIVSACRWMRGKRPFLDS